MTRSKILLAAALSALVARTSNAAEAPASVQPTPEQLARCNLAPNDTLKGICRRAYSMPSLKFPDAPEELTLHSPTKAALYKPAGTGPHPAIVLLHTCAGVGDHLLQWARKAIAQGYVVLVVDSYGPRGYPQGICAPDPSLRFPPLQLRIRDAYEAHAHLSRLPFVDKGRVGAVGFSHGGRVAYMLDSPGVARVFSDVGARFRALVSVYGECFNRSLSIPYVRPDIDKPMLALLGDKDEDGDVRECLPRLQAVKEKGAPVEWHVYSGAGHAWDNDKFLKPRNIPYAGSPSGSVYYAYDARVADDSIERTFAFLAKHLKRE